MRGVEEEKKSDDQDTNVPTQPSPEKPQQQQAAAPSVSSDKADKDPTTTKDSSPVGLAGQSFRCLFLDLPMLLVLTLYAGMQLADYAKEEFFSAQYEGLIWDVARQKEEITYYTRICDEKDITTSDPSEMFLPANGTGEQGAAIMMKHGFTVVPNVVQPASAKKLRDFIDEKAKNLTEEEKIWLVKGKNRYSFNLGTEAPGMTEVLQDLAHHQQLTDTVEAILGPDPAMIEMTVITASYGAEDQWYHDDAVPDGSPSRYAHAFSPALSLFVTLQDLTTDMGITSACPGTHFCAGGDLVKACNKYGFQLADENGNLGVGDTFLFNMNSWHRGAAHKDPNGHDRVMLILSYVPKPKMEAESRQMVHGITYAMRWDMWGFTWNDMKRASTVMVSPFNYLRALGLYKPKDASWGLDWWTSSSMRAANQNNGFAESDVSKAEIFPELVPMEFQLSDDEVDELAGTTNAWFWYCSDQIELFLKILKKATVASFLGYVSVLLMLGLVSKRGFVSPLFGSIRRLACICAIVGVLLYAARRSITSTQWARDNKARRRFHGVMDNQEHFDEVKDGLHALPNRHDVLIESRYGYKDLDSYNNYIDYHPGNAFFLRQVDAVVPDYQLYPDLLKMASIKYITESVLVNNQGRFLEQGQKGIWHLADFETAMYYTKKIVVSRSNLLVGAILKETRHLISTMRYGVYRNTDLAILSAPFLKGLTSKILTAAIGEKPSAPSPAGFLRPPAMKPEYAEDGVTVLRWKQPVPVEEQKPTIKARGKAGSAPESSAMHVPRTPRIKFVAKEPRVGAWILQGDLVEATIKTNWYAGKVAEISAHGNHLIKFFDGDEGFYDEYQIRRVVPWSVGETVEILISDDGTTEVHHKAEIVAIGKDGNITSKTVKDQEIRTDPPSKLRRPVTTVVKEKPGHSYSAYG